MPGFGANAALSIFKQNSFWSAVGSATWQKLPFATQDFNYEFAELTDDSIQFGYDEPDRVTGIACVTGQIVANVHPIAIGNIISGVFGITSTQAAGSGYEHTFNPQTATFDENVSLQPYAFQIDQGEAAVNSSYIAYNCFLNNWELSLAAGQYLRSTINIVGQRAELIEKSPPANYPAGIKPMLWSGCSISIGSVGVQRYADFRLTFNNGIAAQDRIAGAKDHTFFFREGFRQFGRMTGTMDMSMADWLSVKNETELPLVIFCKGASSISSGYDESLKIDIPRFVFTKHPLGVSGPGIVTVAMEGRAMFSSTSGTICTVTLVNTQATY